MSIAFALNLDRMEDLVARCLEGENLACPIRLDLPCDRRCLPGLFETRAGSLSRSFLREFPDVDGRDRQTTPPAPRPDTVPPLELGVLLRGLAAGSGATPPLPPDDGGAAGHHRDSCGEVTPAGGTVNTEAFYNQDHKATRVGGSPEVGKSGPPQGASGGQSSGPGPERCSGTNTTGGRKEN